ncbi:MAG: hypothetical protein SPG52_07590, partial [Candidatus Cryptobacteroides sp.]|nr:hypothetical protein [Candidatus Cryptobacteroides sp.]
GLAISPLYPGFRRAEGAPTSLSARRGALAKHCYQGITQPGGRYFVSVQPLPKASFRRGRPETKLASLFAMLTP